MQLHVPTMLVTTIVSAVMVAFVLPFARGARDTPGLRETTLSAACFAASCTCILLKDHIPDSVRLVPANGLMWLGFALQWLAYARFDAPTARGRLPLGGTALAVIAFALLQAAGGDYRERSLFASATVAALAAGSAWQLLGRGGHGRERARRIGATFAAVTILCQAVRVPMLLTLPTGDGALLSGAAEQSVAFLPAMVHVLGVGLGFLVMQVERNEAEAQATALTDPLTGCANRRAFTARITDELARLQRGGEPFAVVLADIDRFKLVNDTHGHGVGDQVIRHLAAVLRDGIRPGDVVARLGGEEFCVLVRGADVGAAETLALRLANRLRERPADAGAIAIPVTASFGVAAARRDEPWEGLFARVDQALYASKHAGRDRVTCAP
jgi:diguanylate cyclase (GGDEF)-like protein